MRPPKKILLVADDELRAAELRYLLQIWGYRVVAVSSAIAAEQAMREMPLERPFDLLLLVCPLAGAARLLKRAKKIAPYTPTLVLADSEAFLPADWVVDGALCRGQCSGAAIRERVKVLATRKPGPHPGAVRAPAGLGTAAPALKP